MKLMKHFLWVFLMSSQWSVAQGRWTEYLSAVGVAGDRDSEKSEACPRARRRALNDLREDCSRMGGYVSGGTAEACNLSSRHGNYRQRIEWTCTGRNVRGDREFYANETAGARERRDALRLAKRRAINTAEAQCERLRAEIFETRVEDTSCRRTSRGRYSCQAEAMSVCEGRRGGGGGGGGGGRLDLYNARINSNGRTHVAGRSGPPGHPNLCGWSANVSWEIVGRNTLRVHGRSNNDCSGGWNISIQLSERAGTHYSTGYISRAGRRHGFGSEEVHTYHDYRISEAGRYQLHYVHGSSGSELVNINITRRQGRFVAQRL